MLPDHHGQPDNAHNPQQYCYPEPLQGVGRGVGAGRGWIIGGRRQLRQSGGRADGALEGSGTLGVLLVEIIDGVGVGRVGAQVGLLEDSQAPPWASRCSFGL